MYVIGTSAIGKREKNTCPHSNRGKQKRKSKI
jgi:hypothetical protein